MEFKLIPISEQVYLRSSSCNYLKDAILSIDDFTFVILLPNFNIHQYYIEVYELRESYKVIESRLELLASIAIPEKVRYVSWAPKHVLKASFACVIDNMVILYQYSIHSHSYEQIANQLFDTKEYGMIDRISWDNIAFPPTIFIHFIKGLMKLQFMRTVRLESTLDQNIMTSLSSSISIFTSKNQLMSKYQTCYASESKTVCITSSIHSQVDTVPILYSIKLPTPKKSTKTITENQNIDSNIHIHIPSNEQDGRNKLIDVERSTKTTRIMTMILQAVITAYDFTIVSYIDNGSNNSNRNSDINCLDQILSNDNNGKFHHILPGTLLREALDVESPLPNLILPNQLPIHSSNSSSSSFNNKNSIINQIEIMGDDNNDNNLAKIDLRIDKEETENRKDRKDRNYLLIKSSNSSDMIQNIKNDSSRHVDSYPAIVIYRLGDDNSSHNDENSFNLYDEDRTHNITTEDILKFRTLKQNQSQTSNSINSNHHIESKPTEVYATYSVSSVHPSKSNEGWFTKPDMIAYYHNHDVVSSKNDIIAIGSSQSNIVQIFTYESMEEDIEKSIVQPKSLIKVDECIIPKEMTCKGLRFLSSSTILILASKKIKSMSLASVSIFASYQTFLFIQKLDISIPKPIQTRQKIKETSETGDTINTKITTRLSSSSSFPLEQKIVNGNDTKLVSVIEKSSESMLQYLKQMNDQINERFDRVEGRLDQQDIMIKSIANKLNLLNISTKK